MFECEECGHEQYDYNDDDKVIEQTETGIKLAMWKKAYDLQKQLLNHFLRKQELNDVDVVRYTAMVEVLEAMLV